MTSKDPHEIFTAEDTLPDLVILDERIPGTRRMGTFIFVLLFIVVFIAGSRDLYVSTVVLAIGVWMLYHDIFSVFGWEHIVITDSSLRLERRLFGRMTEHVDIARADVVSVRVTPRPRGLERFDEDEDRDQHVFGFDSGPIEIETDLAIYRLGQGYLKDRDAAQALVERVVMMLGLD